MSRHIFLLWLFACTGGAEPDTGGDEADTDTDADADTDADTDTDTDTDRDDDLGVDCPLAGVPLPEPPATSATTAFLPTSNGWVSATWAIDARDVAVTYGDGSTGTVDQAHQVATFTDHLPRQPDPDSWTRDLLWDAYLGIRVDGESTWLNTVPEDAVGYVPGTGIIEVVQRVGDIQVQTFVFAPFHGGATHDLVIVGAVSNAGTTPHEVSLFSLHNAHAGGEGSSDGEEVAASWSYTVSETRGDDALRHSPLDADGTGFGYPDSLTAGPAGDGSNPWTRLTAGEDFGLDVISGDDVAVGFQWDLGELGGGQEATRGLVLSWSDQGASALDARVNTFVAGRTAQEVLMDEVADWEAWHAVESWPSGLSPEERQVALQSTAVLRMGQVREEGSGYGQILASLPPGGWNMSWPRDAAYAILGLVRSGHQDEARAALDFQVSGDAGYYADYLGLDDYLISAARYYGDGTEESDGASCPDGSDAGPNVELDDFGLFLWAYGEYARTWPADPWVVEVLPQVLAGVADPLVAVIEDNDLLTADSSIWERHWEECFPNGRKQFAYSSVMAVSGLRYAAELSGDDTYSLAAERIRSGLLGLSDDGGPVLMWESEAGTCPLLASSPEETCSYCGPYDGSVIEVIDQGVVRPESSLAVGTLGALQSHLAMANGSPGFLRSDDGTGSTNPYPWYDDQEWVVIDLRMAVAYDLVGQATGDAVLQANALTLVDWVTAQAVANHGLIAELYSDGTWTREDEADHVHPGWDPGYDYQGAVPMCGFGPGAYILALEAIHD